MKNKTLKELNSALEKEVKRLNTFILRAIEASNSDGYVPSEYLKLGLTKHRILLISI